MSCCEVWLWVGGGCCCTRISVRNVLAENERVATYRGRVRERLRRPSIFQQRLLKLVKYVIRTGVQIVKETEPLHTLASLSAACWPDIDEVYTDTCARFLACGSMESELERLGYETRCGGAPPFWMGLEASGMV